MTKTGAGRNSCLCFFDQIRQRDLTFIPFQLLVKVDFPDKIVAGSQNVTYIYSASGAKLATNANGSLTYSRSVMVYNGDNSLAYLIPSLGE